LSLFHVELRQFPNVARAFNLAREQVDAQILTPWATGHSFVWSDKRWAPEKAKLTIYEGPALRPEEIGMGRGWANVTRSGEDVTNRVLRETERPDDRHAGLQQLREELVARCRAAPFLVRDSVSIAGELHPDRLVSERLALAERAVWELLHLGEVTIVREAAHGSVTVEREQWQPLLLDWSTWGGEHATELYLATSDE